MNKMKKKILVSMVLLAFISIVSTILFFIVWSYSNASQQVENDIQNHAWILGKVLSQTADEIDYLAKLDLAPDRFQVVVLAADGQVLYCNNNNNTQVNDYLDYPVVKKALDIGSGLEKRHSAALSSETYFYALQLKNGNILLLAQNQASLIGVFTAVLPFMVIIAFSLFLLAMLISKRLAQKIAAPINQIDLAHDDYDEILYEEFTPFIRTLAKQKEQMGDQWMILENWANTIKTITNGMQEGLILLDTDEKILSANFYALKLFTTNIQEYAGQNILVLIRNVELLQCIRMALKGESGTLTMEIRKQSVQVFVNPIWHRGLIKGILILFQDITAQARAEKSRKEFTANVSHELKTPLTTILGYAELINAGMAEDQDTLRFAGKIQTEVKRLISLIESIIYLSELDEKSTGGKEKEEFNINQLLAEVLERLESLAQEKNIRIIADNLPVNIIANRAMIEELLYNLIENAIKYNKIEGVVEIRLEKKEGKTEITVADSGIGIPPEHLDRIFERFYRVDLSRSKTSGGFGLGLSIVKHIVNYHQGTVTINSKVDEGTEVKVNLG